MFATGRTACFILLSMTAYDAFAPFYDSAMGARDTQAALIVSLARKVVPGAASVLEIACGTGALLAPLAQQFPDYYGLDASEAMIAEATKRLDPARLVVADMREFDLAREFDIVVCAYDSINHLERLEDWEQTFRCVDRHLSPNGVFVFDMNTQAQLEAFAELPAVSRWIDDGRLLVMDVVRRDGAYDWHVDVFAPADGTSYSRHCEVIREVAFPVSDVRRTVGRVFNRVEVIDRAGGRPSRWSRRVFFACSRSQAGGSRSTDPYGIAQTSNAPP
jgi:SAM-dependent methyltransferase